MKNMYNQSDAKEIMQRIDELKSDAPRQWGTMTQAQMLAHCSIAMEVVLGRHNPPRIFIGMLLTPFLKHVYYDPNPFRKNSPTAKSFVVSDERDFDKEKARLIALVKEFSEGGPSKCTTHPHAFFGKFSPEQWSIATYKHLDHHLRQFGG